MGKKEEPPIVRKKIGDNSEIEVQTSEARNLMNGDVLLPRELGWGVPSGEIESLTRHFNDELRRAKSMSDNDLNSTLAQARAAANAFKTEHGTKVGESKTPEDQDLIKHRHLILNTIVAFETARIYRS